MSKSRLSVRPNRLSVRPNITNRTEDTFNTSKSLR